MHRDGGHYAVFRSECFPPQVVHTTDMIDVTFASVEEAVCTLQGVAHYTPVLTSCQLDALSGARVFLKCENFQRVGAFKFRGAYHAITRLIDSVNVNQSRIVSMPNRNTHTDGLRTSLVELTLPILRCTWRGSWRWEKRRLYRQCNSPMSDSSV